MTLCDRMDCKLARLLCPWNSLGKNPVVGCHALLQGIFPTQGSNLGLPHCRFFTIWATREALWCHKAQPVNSRPGHSWFSYHILPIESSFPRIPHATPPVSSLSATHEIQNAALWFRPLVLEKRIVVYTSICVHELDAGSNLGLAAPELRAFEVNHVCILWASISFPV